MREMMESQKVESQKENSMEIHNLKDYEGNPITIRTNMEVVKIQSIGNITPILKVVEIKDEDGEWNLYPSIVKKGDVLYYLNAENGEVFLDEHPADGEHKRTIDEFLIPAAREAGISVEEVE